MADPLGGTPQSISPFAPRSPLPGQQPYRPQPLPPPPTSSAWSSPPATPHGHNGQPAQAGQAPAPAHASWAGGSQASSAGSARGGMTPRSPHAYERRRTGEGSEDLGRSGGVGGSESLSSGGAGGGDEGARAGSVRVRVTGLDRTKRDFYVKFNAEVRTQDRGVACHSGLVGS